MSRRLTIPKGMEPSQALSMIEAEKIAIRRQLWEPYPWQVAPEDFIPGKQVWLIVGGRGIGKSESIVRYALDHAAGPPCDPRLPGGHRMAVVAPTIGDALESIVNGPSGLVAHDERTVVKVSTSGSQIFLPDRMGRPTVVAKLFGSHTRDDVNRLRSGGNRCIALCDELAAWRYDEDAWSNLLMGLRIGEWPHALVATTPRPRQLLKDLIADPTSVVTRGSTREATHLDQSVRKRLIDAYGGTRLGRQELEGELLEDVEGALWTQLMLDEAIVSKADAPERYDRVVVGVDPPGSHRTTGAECGIVVVGIADGVAYVLADKSGRMSPQRWAVAAINAYHAHHADVVVAEANFGGDMVASTLRGEDSSVPVRMVRASRGKVLRAEPVVALYEQNKVRHVGGFGDLEDQMASWVPGFTQSSPDRVDALVHGISELMLRTRTTQVANPISIERLVHGTARQRLLGGREAHLLGVAR